MTIVYDGVEGTVVPDFAMCVVEGDRIINMDECPIWKCDSVCRCDPDCQYYTEDWE